MTVRIVTPQKLPQVIFKQPPQPKQRAQSTSGQHFNVIEVCMGIQLTQSTKPQTQQYRLQLAVHIIVRPIKLD